MQRHKASLPYTTHTPSRGKRARMRAHTLKHTSSECSPVRHPSSKTSPMIPIPLVHPQPLPLNLPRQKPIWILEELSSKKRIYEAWSLDIMSKRGVFFYYQKSNFEDNSSHEGTAASALMVTLKQMQNIALCKSSSTPATSREPANRRGRGRKGRQCDVYGRVCRLTFLEFLSFILSF